MKRLIKSIIFSVLVIGSFVLVGCSNSTQNLAKDLNTSVSNFINSVSSLDWPQYEQLDAFDSITIKNADNKGSLEAASKTTDSASNVDDSGVVVDTSIDTSEIYTWIEILRSNINILNGKRADLLLYIDEMYANNVRLSEADTLAVKVYMNIIKDNSTYLSNYKGMLKNQLNEATSLYNQNKNTNLINAYLIKAVETLQSRSAKIDTGVLAMNSIIDILDSNLITRKDTSNIYSISPKQQVQDKTEPEPVLPAPQPKQEVIPDEPSVDNEQTTPPAKEIIDEQPNELEAQPENAINFESEPRQVDSVPEENIEAEQQVSTSDTEDNEQTESSTQETKENDNDQNTAA